MGYRKLTTEVGGVSFMCLLTDELDAVGTVKDNLRGVEAAIKGRKSQGRDLTILDAGEAIKGLWSQIDELTKRGLGRRRPAAPKIIVNWSTAEQAVENVKVWLESLKNPVFSTTGRSPLPKKIGGKPRLETADPLKLQVYERIRKAHCPHTEYWEVVQRLKGDKDFMDQITEAGHQISAKCD